MQVADQRDFYARLITGRAGVSDNVLIEAFATVAREAFVGPGPWQVFAFANGYVETPTNELAYLYQDVLVALASDRRINNGEPSLHARCLAALAPRHARQPGAASASLIRDQRRQGLGFTDILQDDLADDG